MKRGNDVQLLINQENENKNINEILFHVIYIGLKKKSYSIKCLQDAEQYELFHGSGEFGFDSIIF